MLLTLSVAAQERPDAPPRPADDAQTAAPIVVTALRREADARDVPAHVSRLDDEQIRASRNLVDALTREPGVLVQKTGPGQSSPYIRGFTGFHVLHLVDGIRLNNAAFRSGPNQYFGTIDPYSVDSLELTRGPHSVLWGSDAVGGVLNARIRPAEAGEGWTGRYAGRWASAERSATHRLEVEGGDPESGAALRAGFTTKDIGNIKSGDGNQPGTGYDEWDADVRIDIPVEEDLDMSFGYQQVDQRNVPRTHKTVDAVPYHGTTIGSELKRDLDQVRKLAYARMEWENFDSLVDRGRLTLSGQQQRETQDRRRTGGRFDTSGFDVKTLGLQMELETDLDHGTLSWGADAYRDTVDSFRRDFVNGTPRGKSIQGPVGDDSQYDLIGVYIQDEIQHENSETLLGARYSYARLSSGRVDNPKVDGSDPSTPGNVISVRESWNSVVGSVRHVHHLTNETNVWGGLSQGFRAPNLSDLTADLDDSGVEEPTPDLDPEHFVSLEFGVKTDHDGWSTEVAVWHTWVRDMIVQSPTGEIVDGTQVVQKSNAGDGKVYGLEIRGERALDENWTASVVAAWMSGEVDQFTPSGKKVSKPLSRSMPATAVLATTYRQPGADWWFQADLLLADKADQLSLRDEGDTERIPPGGTPGYGVLGLRGGIDLDDRSRLGLAVENIFDRNYRIHGAGVNEPGRNVVLTWDVLFGRSRSRPRTQMPPH